MHSAPNRSNSDFQLRYFIAGDCHTPDGAWALMYVQREAAAQKVEEMECQKLEQEAELIDAREIYEKAMGPDLLRATARLKRAERGLAGGKLQAEGARRELATVDGLLRELEPKCRYAGLPAFERAEVAQREEWRLELMRRAENYIVTSGSIPADHFQAMRMHPDFLTHIGPHIKGVLGAVRQSTTPIDALARLAIEGPKP